MFLKKITSLATTNEVTSSLITKGVRRKIFRGGPIRIEPALTTKNGKIFEIWEVLEKVCENPGWALALPAPLTDVHVNPKQVSMISLTVSSSTVLDVKLS